MIKQKKRGQQEMVGFVIIVVMVIIALFIFLIIYAKKSPVEINNKNMNNMLLVMMTYTTSCSVYEPVYANMRDVIGSCYENRRCSNLDITACDYLKKEFPKIIDDILSVEPSIDSYEARIYYEDESGITDLISPIGSPCDLTVSRTNTAELLVDSGSLDEGNWSLKASVKVCINN